MTNIPTIPWRITADVLGELSHSVSADDAASFVVDINDTVAFNGNCRSGKTNQFTRSSE